MIRNFMRELPCFAQSLPLKVGYQSRKLTMNTLSRGLSWLP